jgi:hypothetical protein
MQPQAACKSHLEHAPQPRTQTLIVGKPVILENAAVLIGMIVALFVGVCLVLMVPALGGLRRVR